MEKEKRVAVKKFCDFVYRTTGSYVNPEQVTAEFYMEGVVYHGEAVALAYWCCKFGNYHKHIIVDAISLSLSPDEQVEKFPPQFSQN